MPLLVDNAIKNVLALHPDTPLHMNDTHFISYETRHSNVAQGYDDATTEMNFFTNYENTRSFASGFSEIMYSSACDLASYANNEFNNDSFLASSTVMR